MDNFNFCLYGHIDLKPLQEKILAANFDWDSYKWRQEKHKVHRETKTIPLIWNEGNFEEVKYWDYYPLFKEEIDKIHNIIDSFLGVPGIIQTAILINLESKAQVYNHFDNGPFFRSSKRIHIPVFTNPDCIFTVDHEEKNMKEGEIWEINNDGKWHGVVNNGSTDRIHLLIDWKKK